MNTAFITKCRCLIQVLYCRLFSQLKFSCGWWILIGQKTKRSKERYKSWEISDVTDITMKQISMGNVNFWISPEKAVSKVRQLLHLECQSSLRLILVVNMSNVNTRNRKPCRVSLDLLKLIIWEATIHSPSDEAKLVSYFLKYFSYDCCCSKMHVLCNLLIMMKIEFFNCSIR